MSRAPYFLRVFGFAAAMSISWVGIMTPESPIFFFAGLTVSVLVGLFGTSALNSASLSRRNQNTSKFAILDTRVNPESSFTIVTFASALASAATFIFIPPLFAVAINNQNWGYLLAAAVFAILLLPMAFPESRHIYQMKEPT